MEKFLRRKRMGQGKFRAPISYPEENKKPLNTGVKKKEPIFRGGIKEIKEVV